jgi:hypothetical protein
MVEIGYNRPERKTVDQIGTAVRRCRPTKMTQAAGGVAFFVPVQGF